MKKILSLLTLMLCMVSFTGCNSDDPETEGKAVEVTVDSKLVNSPAGQIPGLYLKVTFMETNQVRYILPTDILGFNYSEGYIYRLIIKEMHVSKPQGTTNEVYYVLEKIISKEADTSNPNQPIKPAQ